MRLSLQWVTLGVLLCGACRTQSGSRAAYLPRDYEPLDAPGDEGGLPRVELTEAALRIHHSAILVDGHNDLPWKVRDDGESSFDKIDIASLSRIFIPTSSVCERGESVRNSGLPSYRFRP